MTWAQIIEISKSRAAKYKAFTDSYPTHHLEEQKYPTQSHHICQICKWQLGRDNTNKLNGWNVWYIHWLQHRRASPWGKDSAQSRDSRLLNRIRITLSLILNCILNCRPNLSHDFFFFFYRAVLIISGSNGKLTTAILIIFFQVQLGL